MANYTSTAEINNYLWISWDDILINILNGVATTKINNFLWVTTLNATTAGTEIQEYTWWNRYYTKELNPSNLSLVNWSAVVWTTDITGRAITFEHAPLNIDTVFNKINFTYDYWYTDIPDDIKLVVLNIVWYLYNIRKTAGVDSFTQWQITVNYTKTKANDNMVREIMQDWLKKYIKNNIYS